MSSSSSNSLNPGTDKLTTDDKLPNAPASVPSAALAADRENTPLMSPLPLTPRRPSFPSKLSLQMPARGPLSPVLDPALGYSVTRRPRLDFARACTSLHHSTLAETSPDSSPLAPGSCPIPRNGKGLESPVGANGHYHQASSHASSLGSTSMLDYALSGDDSDSTSEEDSLDLDMGSFSTIQNENAISLSLLDHQKARLGTRGVRKQSSNSSASGHSSLTSPPPPPPPPVTPPMPFNMAVDGCARHTSGLPATVGGRRRSLSFPSRDERDRPDPVKRPVSRRGSMLPKTKNFQRIRAALIEESSPIDEEVKREAEVTRQIRSEDGDPSPMPLTSPYNYSLPDPEFPDLDDGRVDSNGDSKGPEEDKDIGISFSKQAQRHGGFWFSEQMEGISGSPSMFPGSRQGSEGDIRMNSESVSSSPASSVPPEIRRVKRRRTQDERFEPSVFKRRAVSPGLSHSPILASSPQSSGKKGMNISFQGMNDTNEGLMKMTL